MSDTEQFITDMRGPSRRRRTIVAINDECAWRSTLADIEAGRHPIDRGPASEFDVEPLDVRDTWDLIEDRFPETEHGYDPLAELFEQCVFDIRDL